MPKKSQRGVAKTDHLSSAPNLNHLSWDDIRVFLACAKEPSFRQAAEKLNISSSTVVRRIDQLEEALGVRLFNRLPEGSELTDAANLIKDSAMNMERSLFELVQSRMQVDNCANGQVSISITEGLGTYWLMPQLVDFQRQFPSLVFNVQCAMKSADVLRLEADVAIQFERPTNPDLIVTRLGYLHSYPFAAQRYIDIYGQPKTINDAKNHRFVYQMAPVLEEEQIWAQNLGVESMDDIVGIKTNSNVALFYAIERGAGIGALATYACAMKAKLVPIDMGLKNRLDIWLTYHPSIKKTPRKAMVVEWIKSIFDPLIYPWFREEFIHPIEVIDFMPKQAHVNMNDEFFAVRPFGK